MSDNPPANVPPGGSGLPARMLSSTELEAVIKRAVELQTVRETEMTDGLSDAEVVRIGKELGLEQHLVRRAIAEVRSRPPEEHGVVAGVMGPGVVRAARTIRRPAVELGMFLERYLIETEFMVVERRLPERTRYVRGQGLGAAPSARWGAAWLRWTGRAWTSASRWPTKARPSSPFRWTCRPSGWGRRW